MNGNPIGYREYQQELERKLLSPYAMLSSKTRGREHPLEPCPLRTEFVRDRDRIIHCKSFRRLKHKTQVFLSPTGDHYRTRLTHTLEVSQIARSIARGLRLNEDLVEAISLGHDLGHTPFGHTGELTLDQLVPGGFEHNVQSLRIVEKLENGTGLNLTYEVRDGILNHKKSGSPCTAEGRVVSLADRIAYLNHDIDDAVRAGVLAAADLPPSCVRELGETHSGRINTLILDVLNTSEGGKNIRMSERVGAAFEELRDFMFKHVYLNSDAKSEEQKATHVVRALYRHYLEYPEQMSEEFYNNIGTDGAERAVADYIACMTDRYAITEYRNLFVPKEWS